LLQQKYQRKYLSQYGRKGGFRKCVGQWEAKKLRHPRPPNVCNNSKLQHRPVNVPSQNKKKKNM